MAEGFLFNMIEKLIGQLGSMVVEGWNMRDDLQNLVQSMTEIKYVVLDAEEQKQGTNNHQVQFWLENLKDTLEDADDLFDDFNTQDLRRHVMTNHKKAKKVRIFFSSSNQLLFTYKMVQKIKELSKRIEALNVGQKKFHFTNRTPEQRVLIQRETHSFIREEEIIGRDEEKKEFIDLLFKTDNNMKENVSVISIIGIGGLGKTALAQLVYGDKEVQQHFQFKKWVCVYDDFDIKGIAAKIIESQTNVEMDKVQFELRKKVGGRRYLLVLDDNWNDDRVLWLELMTLLKDGAKGSKIVITARTEKVAEASGTSSSSIFRLKGLDKKQSWRLFSQLAFKNERELENEKLVSIGKEIVEKCSGVPLAIKSIGSLMYSIEKEDWSTFKNKDLVKIDEQDGNKIFKLIKLSYDHLSLHLKKCFAFCSLFPKDYSIDKTKLIRLWIAQGFVLSSDESSSLEDTGDMYFKDLVHKSFFQNIKKDYLFGDIVSFQMHDIVHDLASAISINDYLLVNEKGQHIDKQTRHVSFGFELDSSWQVPISLLNAYKLRTFLLPQQRYLEPSMDSMELSACNSILSSSRRFRVMNLNSTKSTKISSSIGRMKHLRYLDLSYCNKVEELPRSITELINLETLLLNHCSSLRKLPKDLWKLVSLRHLELDNCFELTSMPHGIGKLTNLQTLTQFVLDTTCKDSAKSSELGSLHNLRGKLKISGLEHLRHCPTEAKHMNLIGKSHLRHLDLNWNEDTVGDVDELEDDIALHSNIKRLTINGFGGVTFSSSANLFTNLVELNLSNCTRLQYFELSLLHVKSLLMVYLPCLEWIVKDNSSDNSSTFSASLKYISLLGLNNLKGWCRCSEEGISRGCCHQFESLENLLIQDCYNLISIPQHTYITNVELANVKEKILQQAVNHSKLEYLSISHILNFKSLRGVFQHLSTLRELFIYDWEDFDPCDDDNGCYSMKWKELANLKYLKFNGIPKMKYLPEGLQHITTLQSLRIIDCVNLTSIPEWVRSLPVFDIEGCPNVKSRHVEVEDHVLRGGKS